MTMTNKFSEMSSDIRYIDEDTSAAYCTGVDFNSSNIMAEIQSKFRINQYLHIVSNQHDAISRRMIVVKDAKRYFFLLLIPTTSCTVIDVMAWLDVLIKDCKKYNIKKLAMTRIGCETGKLSWTNVVRILIRSMFEEVGILVSIYN